MDASVAERGSDIGDRIVEPVALPAGGGFRASYLNALDLAQHVEYHLRTPTGRYLVLAASLPGSFDEPMSSVVDAIASSLKPIPGSSGDRAAPLALASSAPAADLLATLPARVGSVELERQLLDGESLVTSGGEASGSLASSLGVLVGAPADLTLAIGVPPPATRTWSSRDMRWRAWTRRRSTRSWARSPRRSGHAAGSVRSRSL